MEQTEPLPPMGGAMASAPTKHVRVVHEKRRDHACPHCAAAFSEASDLTRHVRTVHEKRRDHACPTAPLRSARRAT